MPHVRVHHLDRRAGPDYRLRDRFTSGPHQPNRRNRRHRSQRNCRGGNLAQPGAGHRQAVPTGPRNLKADNEIVVRGVPLRQVATAIEGNHDGVFQPQLGGAQRLTHDGKPHRRASRFVSVVAAPVIHSRFCISGHMHDGRRERRGPRQRLRRGRIGVVRSQSRQVAPACRARVGWAANVPSKARGSAKTVSLSATHGVEPPREYANSAESNSSAKRPSPRP